MAMTRAAVVVAIVMLANVVDLGPIGPGMPALAQDQAAEVLARVHKALGGDSLAGVTTLSAEGPFRRSMGQREMEGMLFITVQRPDKLRRSEEMSMGGGLRGPSVERISGFDGTVAWEDMQNRGGMGGGRQMIMRGPGDGPGGISPEQIEQQRTRRMKMELQRWTVALLADSAQSFAYAGEADSPEGKADVLETKDEAGQPVRLFVDRQTNLPLMVQYREVRPMMMFQGGPGGPGGRGGRGQGGPPPSREEMEQRIEELRKQGPPPASQFAMYLSNYKKVNGVMLPHRIDVSVEGQPSEEWTIEKFRVNPNVKASEFEKPRG